RKLGLEPRPVRARLRPPRRRRRAGVVRGGGVGREGARRLRRGVPGRRRFRLGPVRRALRRRLGGRRARAPGRLRRVARPRGSGRRCRRAPARSASLDGGDGPRELRGEVLDRPLRARHLVLQPRDDPAPLDPCGEVVDREDERPGVERLLDRRLLGTLGQRVVARRLGLVRERLVPRLDDLVLDVVDHVAADAGGPLGGLDEDVHRALGVAAGRLADDSGVDLVRPGELEVEQAQGAGGVQPVDVVLDVLRRVLLAHQPGNRVLELAPVHHHRRRQRKAVVLAGVVDVAVGVQHGGDVLDRHAVLRQLVLELHLLRDVPLHAEPAHDLGVAGAGVDEERARRVAEDQDPPRVHPDRSPHVAREHEEARLDLDVDQRQESELVGGHGSRYAAGRAVSTRYSRRRMAFETIEALEQGLRDADYLPDRGLATALYLSLRLEKPLLLEGEAGVGKTEAAKALARTLPARLIRLQCYEGLDVAHAVYEWNYSRQLLHIRAAQEGTVSEAEL